MANTPTFEEILAQRAAALARGIRIMEPGRIVSFDPDEQTCSVQPLLRSSNLDEFDDTVTSDQPVIPDCPVVFAYGGGFGESLPIAEGDTVAIVWCSKSMDLWNARGGMVDPETERRNSPSDAIVMPGCWDFPRARAMRVGVPADRAVWGKLSAEGPRIEATDSELLVGGGVAPHQPTINGTAYRAAEDTLLTALGAYATALGAVDPLLAPAAVTLNAAIAAFQAAAGSYLTTVAKVR